MPTNSYDSKRDPLSRQYARIQAPARNAYVAVADPANELPVYGKLRIYNGNAAAQTVSVVLVEEQDDSKVLTLTVPANAVVFEGLVVRRITAIGATVTVHVLT